MIVREAKYNDFEKVYPLLHKLNSTTLSKKDWSNIFVNNFATDEDFCGFVIEDNEQIHGFFGTIFSKRIINGKEYKFCNTTSWIVEEEYRAKSLVLLIKIHKLQNYIFTNFTPSETVYPILKKFDYKDIDNTKFLLKPKPVFSSKVKIITNKFEVFLNEKDLKIYELHKKFNLGFFIVKKNTDYCFVVYRNKKYCPAKLKKITKGKINLQLAEIEYVSNKQLFLENLREILFKISIKNKIIAFAIYKKHLPTDIIKMAKKYKTQRKFVYRGNLPATEIDVLFSEIIILDL